MPDDTPVPTPTQEASEQLQKERHEARVSAIKNQLAAIEANEKEGQQLKDHLKKLESAEFIVERKEAQSYSFNYSNSSQGISNLVFNS